MQEVVTITGATGRLGIPVVNALEKKFLLHLLARNASKARKLFPGKKVVEIDLEAAGVADIQKAVRGSQVVIHLAGLVDVCASRDALYSANFEATRKLVRACEREKIPFFIHCSTIAVYSDSKEKMREDSPTEPTALYGKSKLAGENVVKNSGLKWIVLRPGIIYGPHFKEGFEQLLEQMRRKRAAVIGSGENHLPLVYEGDVANSFLKCIELLKRGNEKILRQVFNIVSDKEPTQREALQTLAQMFNLHLPKRPVPLHLAVAIASIHSLYCKLRGKKESFPPEYVELLARNRVFGVGKAKKLLKFTASTPLEKGLTAVKKSWQLT